MKVWINGELVDEEKATVSVFDHAVLYGDGVFEGIRVYGGKIFKCDEHVDRLFASAEGIRLPLHMSKQEIVDAMVQTIEANGVVDGYIRLVVTRGPGDLGLNPFLCRGSAVFVIADQIKLYPREMYANGLAVVIAKTRRRSGAMVPSTAKTLNYLNNIMAKMEAIDAGVGEAIMLNVDGQVAEATGDNVFIVTGGTVATPPAEAGILFGITRGAVIDLAKELGIPVEERAVMPAELFSADECFLTGTAAEIIAVTRIDDTVIGDGKAGPITTQLLEAFRKLTTPEE